MTTLVCGTAPATLCLVNILRLEILNSKTRKYDTNSDSQIFARLSILFRAEAAARENHSTMAPPENHEDPVVIILPLIFSVPLVMLMASKKLDGDDDWNSVSDGDINSDDGRNNDGDIDCCSYG